MPPEGVFFSHDGGQDDFFALVMLCQAHKLGTIRLLGVSVTGANCFIEAGVRCSRKILDVAGLEDEVEVASEIRMRLNAAVHELLNAHVDAPGITSPCVCLRTPTRSISVSSTPGLL